MTDTGSVSLVRPSPPLFDEGRIAVAGFLARYSGGTRIAYASDLRMWLTWCAARNLNLFDAQRPPVPEARLGKDPSGNPAWYVPNPNEPGKYIKLEQA